MPDQASGGEAVQSQSRPLTQRLQRGFETKVLVPLAVTIVSAATHYLIRKLPMLIEEQILPRLREQGRPETVREVVAETAAVVGERAADVVPGLGEASADGDSEPAAPPSDEGGKTRRGGTKRASRQQPSNEEREEERRRREERRRDRQSAVQKA